ncbi:hypothetical protein PAXRUDRAFT_18557 [Paxillus rubicundulus Ve08.2h10]|uniref:Uncharacterized protein n=1 Tax=Paxillus rubicundulus Ve08.2h10 TaxID=930991 RepID=A0A0D0CXR2_9AGAM|nr:hypothetical protein PAXRUDRAFT_18557 [Paxillus rubicundulus Ve08.2h10]
MDPLPLPSMPRKQTPSAVPTSQKPLSESSHKCPKSGTKIAQPVTQPQAGQWYPTSHELPEITDSDMLDLYDDPLDKFSLMDPQEGTKEFLSALGNGVMLSEAEDSESEDYGQELDTISSTTNGDLGSDSEE